MKKKLYLHIGTHKTGTTSVQKFLVDNTDHLAKYDFSFFAENIIGKKVIDGNTSHWLSINKDELKNGVGARIKNVKKLCTKLSNQDYNNVIMSAEDFSWIFQKEVLEEFHAELKKYFLEIKIIIYLRRQDEQIISLHQQGSKSPYSSIAKFLGYEPRAIPEKVPSHDYYLNYYDKLLLWSDVFGKDNMFIKVFNKNQLVNHDIISDFCAILNIEEPQNGLIKLNVSNGFEKTKAGHLLNQYVEDKELRYFIRDYLSNVGKLVPSRSQAIEYYKYFEENNKKLDKEFNIKFDENFDKYSEEEMDVWDEKSANEVISKILLAINDYSKKSWYTRLKIYIRKWKNLKQ